MAVNYYKMGMDEMDGEDYIGDDNEISPLAFVTNITTTMQAITPEILKAQKAGDTAKLERYQEISRQLVSLYTQSLALMEAGFGKPDQQAIRNLNERLIQLRSEITGLGGKLPAAKSTKPDDSFLDKLKIPLLIVGGIGGIWGIAKIVQATARLRHGYYPQSARENEVILVK